MIAHLQKLGFEFDPPLDTFPETDREDRSKNSITGTITPSQILKLFSNRHIETLLLTRLPLKALPALRGPVKVRLELASGFTLPRQLELAKQARVLLATLGFRESVGYDHRGYTGRPHTRLLGTIPGEQLTTLLKDLRQQPGGWFGPRIEAEDLPAPLRAVVPIVIIEVLPDPAPPAAPPEPPGRGPAHLDKMSADLWALAGQKGREAEVVRLEVILAFTPGDGQQVWRDGLIAAAPSIFIEGRLGPVVTCLVRAGQAQNLAALPFVSVVRLPRPARIAVDPGVKSDGDNVRAFKETGLEWLHKLGYRGRGIRLAIIDSEFAGWEEMVKSGRLPAKTRHIDLTAERSYDIRPEPLPGDPKLLGHGTHCALAAALAAPDAELILIRVDPACPYQLREVAGFLAGEQVRSEYLDLRQHELVADAAVLRLRFKTLLVERKVVLDRFEDEKNFEREYGILGAVGVWIYSDRQWHTMRMAEWERDREEHRQRELRYLKLMLDLQSLAGTEVVACPLLWNDGYPLGGGSPLSQWFDGAWPTPGVGAHDRVWRVPVKPAPKPVTRPFTVPPKRPSAGLWFQSAGNTAGQTWNGLFRDEDDNAVMEFTDGRGPLPRGRWTNELNFIGWQPFVGKASAELPAGTQVRCSLQWREPHDAAFFFRLGDDPYLNPLAKLRLVILRQRDPEGKTLSADDLEVVARSGVFPQRLDNQQNASTYELAVEFTTVKGGRYAVRLERQPAAVWRLALDPSTGRQAMGQLTGLRPTGIRPLGAATLADLEKKWEMRARLFVETVDDTSFRLGRPVLLDFATSQGTVGIPGDARGVVTVAAADANDRLQPHSAGGPPVNLDHLVRPNVLAYDRLRLGEGETGGAYGSSVATAFAAGIAATLRGAGMTRDQFLQYVQCNPGAVLKAPRR
jgi:hypothetical protein